MMEEITIRSTRAQRNLMEWSRRVADCRSSGLSVARWCSEHSVNPKTYYNWQKKVFKEWLLEQLRLARKKIMLSRQTMSNWLLRSADDWLAPIYEELRKLLVARDLLHADETEVQVLHEPGKARQSKSYMWLYRTGSDAERPIVLYEYRKGRGQEYPKAFLKGFRGYLQTDGYAGYNSFSEC